MKNFHTHVTEGGSMVGSGSGANIVSQNQRPLKSKSSGKGDGPCIIGSNLGKADGSLGSGKGANKSKPGLSMSGKPSKGKKKKVNKAELKKVAASGYSDNKFHKGMKF